MTTTLLTLHQRLSEAIGDFIEVDTTTDITTDNLIISTTLNNYDKGSDTYFPDNFWVYVTEGENAGVERQVTAYATATGQLTVRGATLAAESAAVTIRLERYNRTEKLKAIKDAIREVYPDLKRKINDTSLITGNLLPDGNFEWWTSSSAHKFFSSSSITQAKTTTAGAYRYGSTSAKATASGAGGYIHLHSDSWPWLLNIMDETVDLRCWASPQTADDATIQIYTKQADGTEQDTLISTTENPAGEFTKLELENQSINDDLVEVDIRCIVATNGQYVYFDALRLISDRVREYVLPESLQNGHVQQVFVQSSGYSDEICDDLLPKDWTPVFGFKTVDRVIGGTTYKCLQMPNDVSYGTERQILLAGTAPLETLSADTDTISLDGVRINLLIAKAAQILFERHRQPLASEDVGRYLTDDYYWRKRYQELLPKQRMLPSAGFMNVPRY